MGVQICTCVCADVHIWGCRSAPDLPQVSPRRPCKKFPFLQNVLSEKFPRQSKSSPEKVPLITKSSLEKKFPFSQKVPPANETTFCEKGELFKSSPYYKKFP
jgi:hypothetical protein